MIACVYSKHRPPFPTIFSPVSAMINPTRWSLAVVAPLALVFSGAWAQTQVNVFPTNAKVGVGTSSPVTFLSLMSADADFRTGLSFGRTTTANGKYVLTNSNNNLFQIAFASNAGSAHADYTNRLVIDSAGKVGIGTVTPAVLLDLNGAAYIRGQIDTAGTSIELNGLSSGNRYALIDLHGDDTYTDYSFRILRSHTGANSESGIYHRGTGNLVLVAQDAGAIRLSTTATERLSIAANGYVGIGWTTPVTKLHVKATYNDANSGLMIDAGDGGNPETYNLRVFPYVVGGGMVGYKFQTKSSTGGTNTPLVFDHAGNVGIGTSSLTQKLSVNGTIRAKEVVVETGWSDFVFADNYVLRGLDEVASHIQQHRHLPDVPSAAEVEANGLPVGEAQKIMMQKIEELTLYLIAQQNELRSVQAENASLRADIEALKVQTNQH